MGQVCHLAGLSFIFPPFPVQKGQMSSNLPRDRTCFHQLGTCEHECFRLAGIVTSEGDLRQELIETLAAGKYPTFVNFVAGSSGAGSSGTGPRY